MSLRPSSPRPDAAARLAAYAQAGLRASREGAWAHARENYDQATRVAPTDALMWMNLSRACLKLGDLPAATTAAMRAFDLDPASPVACRMAAECLVQQHRPHDAVRVFERLAPEAARDHDWHSAHGNALFLSRRPREAVDAYFKALALNVDAPLAHYRLGLCFMDLAMPLEAAECFRTAVSLDDGAVRALALSLLVHEGRQACDWSRTDDDTRALLDAVDHADGPTGRLLSPFALLAVPATAQQLLHLGALRSRGLVEGVKPLPVVAPADRRPGPIRVGYLSADFHHHATAVLMVELLERRDSSRFEVFLYSHSPDDDTEVTRRIRAACEHFVDVRELTHREIAERMRADAIDIAIDLKGHTRDSRFELLAYRPAPVQAAWLGYPASCGAEFIDYVIGDPVVTPLSHADRYSERIAQLPGCYQPNDRARPLPPAPTRASLGLPEDAVVLCCFNQTYKLSPAMLDLWARILADAPRAVLWMLAWNPHARANLERELAARGIGPQRVFFAPKLDLAGHIARLRAADLFLDTWPCNAHTTASEALWAGVPVLTVPGGTFASRVAASLVTACGLPDLACPDEDAYVALAAALANEPATLQGLKAHLDANRATLPLFDAERGARELEALLVRMHDRRMAGLPPAALAAEPLAASRSMSGSGRPMGGLTPTCNDDTPRRYRVAAVMIARDEAARIVRALASVRPHVDEIVVLDTGSRDATVALARSAGARVGRFEWVDDFSAARNAALDLAGADWHVVIDADEWLDEGNDALLALRHTPPTFVGALRVDSHFDDGRGDDTASAPSWLPRVLPGAVRYTGRIHEQPAHALPVKRLDVVFGHDGYRPEALRAKSGRNRALLERAVAQAPHDAYLHYQLGKDHDAYERYPQAAECFARSRACELAELPETGADGTNTEPGWHHDRLVREIHALKRCKRHAEAVLLAEPSLAAWPESPDLFFALGDLLLDWAAESPDRAEELLPMVETAWTRCLEIGERPDLEGSVAGRGSVLAARNLAVLYDGTGRPEAAAKMRAVAG